jgi:NAD-dependent deacetylase
MNLSNRFRQVLGDARAFCVLTGAGISAESGVPTFRGVDGLWKKFKPEELASFDAFIRNPDLVWEWYNYRRQLIDKVTPNPGHLALAKMEDMVETFTLVTQNVDNLHHLAGSRKILELHGNIMRSYCIECGASADRLDLSEKGAVPKCGRCGGLIRPDVVWFGEMLPADVFEEAERAASLCDVFLCVGTSAIVYPAALLPQVARRAGAYTVEINTEATDQTELFDEVLLGKAGELLPYIVENLLESKGIKL